MTRYYLCKRYSLLQHLQAKGFQPIATFPVENKRDKWEYVFENSIELKEEVHNFFKNRLNKNYLKNI